MKTFIVILVLAIVLVGGYILIGDSKQAPETNVPAQNDAAQNSTSTTATSSTDSTSSPQASSGQASTSTASYTMSQVATHNKSTDCWAAVGGKVYNLTSWIAKHPGGREAILGLCGKDGTTAFTKQHGSSAKAQTVLASFLVGTLK